SVARSSGPAAGPRTCRVGASRPRGARFGTRPPDPAQVLRGGRQQRGHLRGSRSYESSFQSSAVSRARTLQSVVSEHPGNGGRMSRTDMRMDHDYIADQDLVGRYMAGTLPFDERARFEAHFVDCPRCLDALDDVEPFQTALHAFAVEDAARTSVAPA